MRDCQSKIKMFASQIRAGYSLARHSKSLYRPMTYACFSSAEKPLVTITGVEGFLGSQTLLQLSQDGGYRIRGTIREGTTDEHMAPIKAAIGKAYDDIEIVKAEMTEEASISNSIKGSTYVIHHAAPYFFNNKTLDELVRPSVEGTLSVMRACTDNNVKRLVATSSIAAIRNTAKADSPPDGVYDETYWSNPDRPEGIVDYAVGKTMAERAAWEYVEKTPGCFEVVMINPVLIIGPSIAFGGGVSEKFVESLIHNERPSNKPAGNGYVDVREVAAAHIAGMKVPEANGKRFLLQSDERTKKEIATMLRE